MVRPLVAPTKIRGAALTLELVTSIGSCWFTTSRLGWNFGVSRHAEASSFHPLLALEPSEEIGFHRATASALWAPIDRQSYFGRRTWSITWIVALLIGTPVTAASVASRHGSVIERWPLAVAAGRRTRGLRLMASVNRLSRRFRLGGAGHAATLAAGKRSARHGIRSRATSSAVRIFGLDRTMMPCGSTSYRALHSWMAAWARGAGRSLATTLGQLLLQQALE